ncbi:MAG: hypothetical protein HY720_25255 [Planctomycetes bacterium]|nr:hypothetical protein [Planctomycetota bacterium]
MRRFTLMAGLVLAVASGAALGQATDEEQAAAKLYGESCSNCHRAPDLRFDTDRAWLDQIERTA